MSESQFEDKAEKVLEATKQISKIFMNKRFSNNDAIATMAVIFASIYAKEPYEDFNLGLSIFESMAEDYWISVRDGKK
ncbi:MAG: hypothetical protein QW478_11260 [Candidatus Micrarchaeaceae archaeon]